MGTITVEAALCRVYVEAGGEVCRVLGVVVDRISIRDSVLWIRRRTTRLLQEGFRCCLCVCVCVCMCVDLVLWNRRRMTRLLRAQTAGAACVCVYVCVYLCMYVCVYVCVCVCMWIR